MRIDQMSDSNETVMTIASDSCSWLIREELDVVLGYLKCVVNSDMLF